MLDLREQDALGIKASNILNDISSHWKTKSKLSAQRMGPQ